jgi:hypothetical protein
VLGEKNLRVGDPEEWQVSPIETSLTLVMEGLEASCVPQLVSLKYVKSKASSGVVEEYNGK